MRYIFLLHLFSGLARREGKDHPDSKSGASVIFFLDDMVQEGILEYAERSDKARDVFGNLSIVFLL